MLDPQQVHAVAEKMGIEGGAEMLRVVAQALCFTDKQVSGLANEAHMKVKAIRTGGEFAKHRAAAAMLGVDDAKIKRLRNRDLGGKKKSKSKSKNVATAKDTPTSAPTAPKKNGAKSKPPPQPQSLPEGKENSPPRAKKAENTKPLANPATSKPDAAPVPPAQTAAPAPLAAPCGRKAAPTAAGCSRWWWRCRCSIR